MIDGHIDKESPWRRLDLLVGLGDDTLQCGHPRERPSAAPARDHVGRAAGSDPVAECLDRSFLRVFKAKLREIVALHLAAKMEADPSKMTKADFSTPIVRLLLM